MDERTETEILTQAPEKVVLGGQEYGIKHLPICDSPAWREKVVKAIADLQASGKVTAETEDDAIASLRAVFVTVPEKVVDLFFAYARDLPREQISAKASDTEVAKAFDTVMVMGFPLVGSLTRAMALLSR